MIKDTTTPIICQHYFVFYFKKFCSGLQAVPYAFQTAADTTAADEA